MNVSLFANLLDMKPEGIGFNGLQSDELVSDSTASPFSALFSTEMASNGDLMQALNLSKKISIQSDKHVAQSNQLLDGEIPQTTLDDQEWDLDESDGYTFALPELDMDDMADFDAAATDEEMVSGNFLPLAHPHLFKTMATETTQGDSPAVAMPPELMQAMPVANVSEPPLVSPMPNHMHSSAPELKSAMPMDLNISNPDSAVLDTDRVSDPRIVAASQPAAMEAQPVALDPKVVVANVNRVETEVKAVVANTNGVAVASKTPVADMNGVAVEPKTPVADMNGVAVAPKAPVADMNGVAVAAKAPVADMNGVAVEPKAPVADMNGVAVAAKAPVADMNGVAVAAKAPVADMNGVAVAPKVVAANTNGVAMEPKAPVADVKGMAIESKGVVVNTNGAALESKIASVQPVDPKLVATNVSHVVTDPKAVADNIHPMAKKTTADIKALVDSKIVTDMRVTTTPLRSAPAEDETSTVPTSTLEPVRSSVTVPYKVAEQRVLDPVTDATEQASAVIDLDVSTEKGVQVTQDKIIIPGFLENQDASKGTRSVADWLDQNTLLRDLAQPKKASKSTSAALDPSQLLSSSQSPMMESKAKSTDFFRRFVVNSRIQSTQSVDPSSVMPTDTQQGVINQVSGMSQSSDTVFNHFMHQPVSQVNTQTDSARQSWLGGMLNEIDVPVDDRRFGDKVSEKVMAMMHQNVKEVQIQLDPPELGALTIKIHMQAHDQAQVSMVAQHAMTREVLDQNAQRLREMMAQEGVALTGYDVQSGRQDSSQSQSGGQSSQHGQSGHASGHDAVIEMDNIPVRSAPVSDGLVDHFV